MAKKLKKRTNESELFPGFSDVAEIAGGGFATVYRAKEIETNRDVALKVLNIREVSEFAEKAFQRETVALGGLSSHPNIVTLYRSLLTPDGRPILVMELCKGSVSDSLPAGESLPIQQVVSLGIKISGALETAHRAGMLHRDVKPQNLLMTQYGEPALADFGVALLQSSSEATANVMGFTTLHAAPELLEGSTPSPATDVYELASTLYQLAAGQAAFRSFDGEAPAAVILRILRDPVAPLHSSSVPLAFSDLLVWAMSKDPKDRPQTALEFAERLKMIEASENWPSTQCSVLGLASSPPPGDFGAMLKGVPQNASPLGVLDLAISREIPEVVDDAAQLRAASEMHGVAAQCQHVTSRTGDLFCGECGQELTSASDGSIVSSDLILERSKMESQELPTTTEPQSPSGSSHVPPIASENPQLNSEEETETTYVPLSTHRELPAEQENASEARPVPSQPGDQGGIVPKTPLQRRVLMPTPVSQIQPKATPPPSPWGEELFLPPKSAQEGSLPSGAGQDAKQQSSTSPQPQSDIQEGMSLNSPTGPEISSVISGDTFIPEPQELDTAGNTESTSDFFSSGGRHVSSLSEGTPVDFFGFASKRQDDWDGPDLLEQTISRPGVANQPESKTESQESSTRMTRMKSLLRRKKS
jgi:serine/threonine protein kinase